jgi:hypothetical protein
LIGQIFLFLRFNKHLRKPGEKDRLALQYFAVRLFKREPLRPVELGKLLLPPGLRRPLHLEAVAAQLRRIPGSNVDEDTVLIKFMRGL